MLSDVQISKFQELYKNRFGRTIDREQALEMGVKLIRLVQLIYKPITDTEYKKLQERRHQTEN